MANKDRCWIALGALSVASLASAQAIEQNVSPAPNTTSLEEVIVKGYRIDASTSATGIVTDILDTPISITAVTGEFLQDTASNQLMDAIGSMTGVVGQANSGETGTNFSVRGFPVQPQVDGFNTLSFASGVGSSAAVERVEVIKGPSAVFNGNVPPGGSVNIIYRKPSFTRNNSVELGVGSWDYKSGEVFSTGPLFSDKLAYLVDASWLDADGWVKWTQRKEKTFVVGLTYAPTDRIDVTLNYRRFENDIQASTVPAVHEGYLGSGSPWFVPLDNWVAANYGPDEPVMTIGAPQLLPGGRRYNTAGPQNTNGLDAEMASLQLNARINDHIEIREGFMYQESAWRPLGLIQSGQKILGADGRSSILSGFLTGESTRSGWENKLEAALTFDTGPISHQMLVGYNDQYSQDDEFKVWLGAPALVNGEPWDYNVDGARMLRDELNARLAVNPQPDILLEDYNHTRTHAYYVAEQMSMLNDRLRALLGGRYTETQISGARVTKTTPQIGFIVKPFSADSRFAATSIFANYSESFTPSGLLQPGTTQVVPPKEGVGREIGIKTAWFGGEVQSTISWFQDDLENIATPDYSTQGQQGAIVSYHLGGKGRSEGAEAEVIWTPSAALQVSANYTYMPTAKYLAYPGVPQLEGTRFPSTPKQQWNLIANYQLEGGPLDGLYLGGWVHGQSETRGSLGGDWKYGIEIPDLVQVDAFLGYKFKQLDTKLNIKNIGDRGGYVMNNIFQSNPPRSVYLSVNYSL